VTRGTRPKKPSSSCGFAHEARGARGSWGLKTENRKKISSLFQQPTTKKIIFIYFYFYFFTRPRGPNSPSTEGERGGREGRQGQGDDLVRVDGPMSARTHRRVRADALRSARTGAFLPQVTS
jgi:hypothetical protein